MRTIDERIGGLGAAVLIFLALMPVAPAIVRADDSVRALPGEWSLLDAPLGPPGELRVEPSGETSVSVKWSPSRDDEAMVTYEVFRAGNLAVRTRSLSFTDSGLTAAAHYCYLVRAVDLAGKTSESTGSVCVTTPDLTPPETPAAPTIVLDSPTSVAANWPATTDNVGVAGYEVLRGGRPHLSPGSGAQTAPCSPPRPTATRCGPSTGPGTGRPLHQACVSRRPT